MIPRLEITIKPIKGERYRATITDLDGKESLYSTPGNGWPTKVLMIDCRTYEKATLAAAAKVAQNLQRVIAREMLAARECAETVTCSLDGAGER